MMLHEAMKKNNVLLESDFWMPFNGDTWPIFQHFTYQIIRAISTHGD